MAAVDVMLALTPLALFALAVAASAARGGVKPGLVAAALAALVSNYLFVAPRYELSFDGEVARLIVLYLAAVPVARFVATRVRLRRARRQNAAPSPAPADDAALLPAGLGAMAPLLAAACGVVALAVPMLAGAAGHPAPVPAVVVAAAFFLVLVSTRRPRGR